MTAAAAPTPPQPGRVKRAGALAILFLCLVGIGAAVSLALLVAASVLADREGSEDGRSRPGLTLTAAA